MALNDTRGSMDKRRPPKEKIDIIIEEEQWESPESPRRFTWKHGLVLALIIAVSILFAFGFLIIAGIVLLAVIIINIFLFIIRKLQ